MVRVGNLAAMLAQVLVDAGHHRDPLLAGRPGRGRRAAFRPAPGGRARRGGGATGCSGDSWRCPRRGAHSVHPVDPRRNRHGDGRHSTLRTDRTGRAGVVPRAGRATSGARAAGDLAVRARLDGSRHRAARVGAGGAHLRSRHPPHADQAWRRPAIRAHPVGCDRRRRGVRGRGAVHRSGVAGGRQRAARALDGGRGGDAVSAWAFRSASAPRASGHRWHRNPPPPGWARGRGFA